MWELYLITRIGIIHNLSIVILAISAALVVAIYMAFIIFHEDFEINKWQKSKFKKFANRMFIVFGISSTIATITPTTEEAYLIYGVGSTIDYIQDNPKVKQLPDKCIDALNRWVDNISKEETKKEK